MSGHAKTLKQQRAALHACAKSLAVLERRIDNLSRLRVSFAAIWPKSDIQEGLRAKAGKVRETFDPLLPRIASADREVPGIDGTIEQLDRDLLSLHRDCQAFVGLMLARKCIASGELSIGAVSDPPTVPDCQRALIAIAERQRDRVRRHIDELTEVKPTFDGPWPEELDLGKLDVETRNMSDTLELCRKHLRGGQDGLVVVAMASLMDMIEIMKRTADSIQDRRCELALHTLLGGMFDDAEKSSALADHIAVDPT